MKLSRLERWVLYNQYQIIELLTTDPYEKQRARDAQNVLANGYTFLYREYCPAYDEGVEEDLCLEALDILNLFSIMQRSATGIDPKRLRFPGFDGNDEIEVKYLSFAKFFCDERVDKRYQELDRPDDFNSHFPMLDSYRSMLDEWRRLGKPTQLNITQQQIEQILKAGGF